VAHLSGGNQQKLLFARVLMRAPRVLLLDEPTKGVDAGTRHEIYRLIVDLAEKGVALLVVASELEEVIGLCDRCLVVADGRIVDGFARGEGSEERVLRAVAAAQAASQQAAPAAVLP
jgi:ribose transport system ATP-binding protein/D-xylose transport system ATP-binding protein